MRGRARGCTCVEVCGAGSWEVFFFTFYVSFQVVLTVEGGGRGAGERSGWLQQVGASDCLGCMVVVMVVAQG